MSVILIADDDPDLRHALRRMLEDRGFTVIEAGDGVEAVERSQSERPDVALLDVRMPRMDGLAAMEAIKRQAPNLPVIIMTGFGTTETAIEAMKRGALDYTLKPLNDDEICEMLERALQVGRKRPTASLQPDAEPPRPNQLVGSSRAMQRVYKAIGQVAESDVHVLVLGESGTGKELVSRAIHQHSKRSTRPFIAINCAAIPETLIESELFGHEKGAFTGATDRKAGLLQACEGGAVFLDEIVELPHATQAKLLRFLQEGEIIRLGGDSPIQLDVRVIAASNTDLKEAVAKHHFREDLFYRLDVMSITVPPLRERFEDLEELVAYFVSRYNAKHGKAFSRISADVIQQLREHLWPGNVRELENLIRKAVIVGQGETLQMEHLFPDTLLETVDAASALPELNGSIDAFIDQLITAFDQKERPPLIPTMERLIIQRVLERVDGNQVKAAKLLGISRNTLRHRITKFGLKQTTSYRGGT